MNYKSSSQHFRRYIESLRNAPFDIRAQVAAQTADFLEKDIMALLREIAPDPELSPNPQTKVRELEAAMFSRKGEVT